MPEHFPKSRPRKVRIRTILSTFVLAFSSSYPDAFCPTPRLLKNRQLRLSCISESEIEFGTRGKNLALAIVLATTTLLAPTADWNALAVQSSSSPMLCATKNCQTELSRCMADSMCAPGLACLLRCQFQNNEGDCQVRCMDLYENKAMQALTDCTLTENKCYPPLPEDKKYPDVAKNLAAKTFDLHILEGDWYVAAGWNTAFDCFPCAKHSFVYNDGKNWLDALFSYRITRDDGSTFERQGKKIISQNGNVSGRLQLKLDPDRMEYIDDWTVLAYEPDGYIVVHYHGSNVAWKGYGGLNIYTRDGAIPNTRTALNDIEQGLGKVGLSLNDLTQVDNTCREAL